MNFPSQWRLTDGPFATEYRDRFGAFIIPSHHANGRPLRVIADSGEETKWQHVSVSIDGQAGKTPSWREMCLVKDLFWDKEECVCQFHPPSCHYVNNHPGCLHMWRPVDGTFPMPPVICV